MLYITLNFLFFYQLHRLKSHEGDMCGVEKRQHRYFDMYLLNRTTAEQIIIYKPPVWYRQTNEIIDTRGARRYQITAKPCRPLKSLRSAGGELTRERWPREHTSAATDGGVYDTRAAPSTTNDGHVDRMKVTFILAAISTGIADLTTAPAVNSRVWRTVNQLLPVGRGRDGDGVIITSHRSVIIRAFELPSRSDGLAGAVEPRLPVSCFPNPRPAHAIELR